MNKRLHLNILVNNNNPLKYHNFSLWSTTQNKKIHLYLEYDTVSHTISLHVEDDEQVYSIHTLESLHQHLCAICPGVSYTLDIRYDKYTVYDHYVLRFDSLHPDTMLFERLHHAYWDVKPTYYSIPAPLPAAHRIPSHVPWVAIAPPTDRIINHHYAWTYTPGIYSYPQSIVHTQHIPGPVDLYIRVSIHKKEVKYTLHMHESNVALHRVLHHITDTHPIRNHAILTPEQVASIITSFPEYIQAIRRQDDSIPPFSQHTIVHTCSLLSAILSHPDTHAYILSTAETAQALYTTHYRHYPGPKDENAAITQATYALATPPIYPHTPEYPHQYLRPDHPAA